VQADIAPSATNPTAPARVLLAEDDSEFRALLATMLREDGYDVVEAADGTALLDRLAEAVASEEGLDCYDLVVTDVKMPGYDAFEIMLGMRRCKHETPFVLMTAFGDAAAHERARQLGAVAMLDKPFDLDDLRVAVSRAARLKPPFPY
jgi:CheY-like chemotaxis protein